MAGSGACCDGRLLGGTILQSVLSHSYIMYTKIVFCLLEIQCLMNNEFVNVHNEPKTIPLRARMQWKQQQSRFQILQFSKQSCTVNVIICVNNMRRMQLSLYRANGII
jgi:hypothetical protein